VLPHGKLQKLEPELWCVEADLHRWLNVQRRMFIVRLSDGRLVFLNGIPLEEPFMRELEDWGAPSFLIVPTGMHRLDIHAWKQRYPKLYLLTSASFHDKVQKVAPVDGGYDMLPREARFRFIELEGARGEPAVFVGGTLCFPVDVFMNIPELGGIEGVVFGALGSIGGPRIPPTAKWFVVDDRDALRDAFMKLATDPALEQIVPCHGKIVKLDVRGVLRRAAASL
jgi:hypothetical protein